MALVSYPYASSESGESDGDVGADTGNQSVCCSPSKNTDGANAFNVEDEFPFISDDQNTPDGTFSCQPSAVHPEFKQNVAQLKSEVERRTPCAGLNLTELQKLCGSQAKRVSAQEIDLIEIDGSSFFNSQPNIRSSDLGDGNDYVVKKFKSSRLQKSKHHITFLAEHAKLHEREINLLRANRFHNKRKTRERYGF